MKNILFLTIFIFMSSTILFAEETRAKTFNIGNGGILKIKPLGFGFDIQIIYNKASEAPDVVKENLENSNPAYNLRSKRLSFDVKFLDRGGYEVCKQSLLFSDFILDETNDPPVAVLNSQTEECGVNSYNKVYSVVVNYDSPY